MTHQTPDSETGQEFYASLSRAVRNPYKLSEFIEKNRNILDSTAIRRIRELIVEELEEEDNRITISEYRKILSSLDREWTYKTASGKKVYFQDYRQISPVLDFSGDRLYMIVPFPTDIPVMDRKGDIVGQRRTVENFVVTSAGELMECMESEFTGKDLIPRFPEMVLDQRWSMGSIRAFMNEGADIDPFGVFRELKGIHDFYMDFGDNNGAATVNALYSILTYVFPLFPTIPYLRFTGTKGAAKSKEIAIHENTDFNALNAVNFSPASMFRTIQDTRGTMLIDEAETYGPGAAGGEAREALNQIVNSGFQAQGKVPRIENIAGRRVRVNYSTYSPKIIGGINEVTETLRDRSFEILLVKTLDMRKSSRSVRSTDRKWQSIRDSLYLLAMNHWQEIRDTSDSAGVENRLDLIGREWDKARPLLVIAHFLMKYNPDEGKEVIEELWRFLEQQREREEELQVDSLDYSVIEALEDLVERELLNSFDGDGPVRIQLLELSMKIADLEGRDIERINKKTYGKTVKDRILKMGLGVGFRRGKGNLTYFETDKSRVRAAKERYLHSNSQDVSNPSNPSNLSNPFNFSNPVGEVTENHSNLENNPNNTLSNPSETTQNSEKVEDQVTEVTQVTQNRNSMLILMMRDFDVAWKDRDWKLHSQDLVHLDPELADELIRRKITRRVSISQSRPPTMLQERREAVTPPEKRR